MAEESAPTPDGRSTNASSFGDDVDTVPQCTGECCDPVTLAGGDYLAMSRDPRPYRNARYIMNMLISRAPIPRHGWAEFTCKYFDLETRRCGAYDRRPQMCRDFPEEGECGYCGGRFATGKHQQVEDDARGPDPLEVAKMRALRTLIGIEMGKLDEAGGGRVMKPPKKTR